MRLIPVAGPSITDKEVEYVTDAARNAWYEGAYDYIKRFEGAFADYLGLPHAISLPSGTGGIHLGLAAMGVGPGDEVIVPDITWIASASPIIWLGASPVFADIDPVSWCITPESFEECITPRTKAVVVVDLYGNMPQMDAIREIASAHGVAILEDAAEAIGASYDGKLAGTLGEIGVFSFHGSKTMTTGEGGMLVTADDHFYRRCILLRDHGRDPAETQKSKKYWNLEIGYKYLMSPVLAALGLAQIERIDELVANKLRIFEWYRSRLGADQRVALNEETPGTKSSYWLVNAILDPSLGPRQGCGDGGPRRGRGRYPPVLRPTQRAARVPRAARGAGRPRAEQRRLPARAFGHRASERAHPHRGRRRLRLQRAQASARAGPRARTLGRPQPVLNLTWPGWRSRGAAARGGGSPRR